MVSRTDSNQSDLSGCYSVSRRRYNWNRSSLVLDPARPISRWHFLQCFQLLEVVPLILLTRDAWTSYASAEQPVTCATSGSICPTMTFYFLMAVDLELCGCWNFGFLINMPIISYLKWEPSSPQSRACALMGRSVCLRYRSWCFPCGRFSQMSSGNGREVCPGIVLGPQQRPAADGRYESFPCRGAAITRCVE